MCRMLAGFFLGGTDTDVERDLELHGRWHRPWKASTMEQDTQTPTVERSCPLGFIVLPAFVGGLIWLLVLLARWAVIHHF